jgi:hypothetical protein
MPIKSRRKRIRKSKEFIRVKRTRITRITRRGNRRHHNGGNYDDGTSDGASNGNNFEQFTKNAQTTINKFSDNVREKWSGLFSAKP